MKNLFVIPSSNNYLNVADKPLSSDNPVIRRLSVDEIIDEFCFEYSENIILDDKAYQFTRKNAQSEQSGDEILQRIHERLVNPLSDSLVVCHINDEVGHGLFTREPIEEGTIVGIYAGQCEDLNGASYQISLAHRTHPKFEEMCAAVKSGDYMYALQDEHRINAALKGGAIRFIQHMPMDVLGMLMHIDATPNDKQSLKKLFTIYCGDSEDSYFDHDPLELKRELKSVVLKTNNTENIEVKRMIKNGQILSANLMPLDKTINGISVIFMIAMRRIEANEQLGYTYGVEYWVRKNMEPKYFDKNTNLPISAVAKTTTSVLAAPTLFKPVKDAQSKSSNAQASSSFQA